MTYLYETIPSREGEEVKRYEIQQSIHDLALTTHPETGEPIRRVILGGWGLITGKSSRQSPGGGTCTPGGGCC
ncbi:MAG: zinc ribbon domain-containing protein [Verrucomicrobiales bacterium]|nr:zinc ribbon domain-containing protein [Verrucomicrobiales bacterium]